jgi:hypothetical protein
MAWFSGVVYYAKASPLGGYRPGGEIGLGNTPQNSGREAERRAGEAARRAHPWIERLARFGYAAKGTVYLVTGALAVGVATGVGGRATDQRGALEEIGAQYFGRVLLGLIAVGLVGYVVWRLVQVAADPDGEGRNARGIARRIGYGLSAAVYAGLALTAGQLALASGGDGGGSPEEWTAWLLSWPLGWVLVAGVGAGVAGYGVHQLYQAYEAEFRQYLELGRMSARVETWITRGGRFGLVARGVVFGIVGLFLVLAALQFNPSEAGGLGDALQTLLRRPFGAAISGVVAFGLVSYGLFMLAVARYRRISRGRV